MGSLSPRPARPDCDGRVWYFGDCEFDERRYELRIGGKTAPLETKPLEVLHQLLIRSGEVVRKEELLEAVWPGVIVVDASLATAVSKLRKVLGEEDALIKTIPKVGYRLAVTARCEFATDPKPNGAESAPTPHSLPDIPPQNGNGLAMRARHWRLWLIPAMLLLVLTVTVSSFRTASRPASSPNAVAILPFQNLGSNHNFDYVSSAIPDEIANALSAARSLELRPLTATRGYTGSSLNLSTVAHALNVNRIVTGNYLLAQNQLQITMELVDTDQDRVLWHDTVNVPANNLLSLQAQIAAMSRHNLAGALGAADFVVNPSPRPQNEEAYELYLRSTAIAWDPEPNRQALEMLRKSVRLDPNYAPAWGLLSLRYYTYSRFGGGGPEALQLSDAAAEKQLTLDPNSPDPVAELTIHRTERGELVKAYQDASELVDRRPDNPNNHHVLNYVLRYSGSIQEAAHQCDLVALLASRFVWGSCSTTWMEAGDYEKARKYLRKDLDSEWSKAHGIEVYLRWGRPKDALRIPPPRIAGWESYKMVLACAAHEPESKIKALAAAVRPNDDPEVTYFFAGHLAYCGQPEAALNMLSLAIKGNYCSYPTMDLDPMFDRIRSTPGFAKVRAAGIACHKAFVENRLPNPTTPTQFAINDSRNRRAPE